MSCNGNFCRSRLQYGGLAAAMAVENDYVAKTVLDEPFEDLFHERPVCGFGYLECAGICFKRTGDPVRQRWGDQCIGSLGDRLCHRKRSGVIGPVIDNAMR